MAHYQTHPETTSLRGRPRVDSKPVMVRMHQQTVSDIDRWIGQQGAPFMTRPEAIRRLLKMGLDKL